MIESLIKYDWFKKNKNKKFRLKRWHKILIVIPIIAIALIYRYSEFRKNYLLSRKGVSTTATIEMVSFVGVQDPYAIENVAYSFWVKDSLYRSYTIARTGENYIYTPNGMPLTAGDMFELTYLSDKPSINEINFDKPTKETIDRYLLFTISVLQRMDFVREHEDPNRFSQCIALEVYKKMGLKGLKKILFHEETWLDNFSSNSYTFKKMKSTPEFKIIVESCR